MTALWMLASIAVGLLLAVAVLPWRDEWGTPGPAHWLAWVCFWPFLLLFAVWYALLAYRKAWWDYSDRKQTAKNHAQQENAPDAVPDFPAHQTVKDTYFKKHSPSNWRSE
jgi:hypothetical protein